MMSDDSDSDIPPVIGEAIQQGNQKVIITKLREGKIPSKSTGSLYLRSNDSMKEDKEFVLLLLRSSNKETGGQIADNLPKKLALDKEIIIECLKHHDSNTIHEIPHLYQECLQLFNDKEIVTTGISYCEPVNVHKFISWIPDSKALSDPDVVWKAIRSSNNAGVLKIFGLLPMSIRSQRDIALHCLMRIATYENRHIAMTLMPPELRSDAQFIKLRDEPKKRKERNRFQPNRGPECCECCIL